MSNSLVAGMPYFKIGNLDQMDPAAREKLLTSLSRLILFRALEREPLERLKLAKEAGINNSEQRITTAAFQVASNRLANVFGFQLNRLPKYTENIKPLNSNKFKDRYYLQNAVVEGQDGKHSKAIHMTHQDSAIENGLLMLVLAFIYCKGDCRADGSRWILDRDLYRLLNSVDEAIPEEPPAQGTARAKASHRGSARFREHGSLTPNVDALLEKFVNWDFLVKEKATDDNYHTQHTALEEGDMLYSMGPRSLMEIGKKQIIHFCSAILDEEPDPTMLKDLEEELQEAEDDEVYMDEA